MKPLPTKRSLAPFCKSIVAAVILSSALGYSNVRSQVSTAGNELEECLYDDAFSKALGVLVYNEVFKPYKESINPNVFFSALGEHYVHPVTEERIEVELSYENSNDSKNDRQSLDENIREAEKIVSSWTARNALFDKEHDLATHYKNKENFNLKQTKLGVLYRELYSEDSDEAQLLVESCNKIQKVHADYANGTKVNENWVCTQEEQVNRKWKCMVSSDPDFIGLPISDSGQEIDYYERSKVTKKYRNVKAAWVETLNVLDGTNENAVFEFLIPANLLEETALQPMWFLAMKVPIAVKD